MYDRILVPVDGSEKAEEALEIAREEASTHSAEVHVLNVIDQSNDNLSGLDLSAVNQLKRSRSELVSESAEKLRNEGLDVESRVVHGVPHEEIKEYVQSNDIDGVFMGSTGETDAEGLLIGSLADKLVRVLSVPVTVV